MQEMQPYALNEEANAPDELDTEQKESDGLPLSQQAASRILSRWKILLRVLNLCLGSFYFGYSLAYFGTFQFSTIVQVYGLTGNLSAKQGLLQGCIPIGGGIGALSSSLLLKNLSRRNSLLAVNLLALGAGIMLLVPNYKILIFARFFQGICVGLYSALIPLLIKQYTPKQLSGTYGALNQTFIAFGVFYSYVFQLNLLQISTQAEHWKMVFGFTLITIALQSVLLMFAYKEQTPNYLLLQGREQQCVEYLKKMYHPDDVEKVLKQKKSDVRNAGNSPLQTSIQNKVEGEEQMRRKGKRLRIMLAIHLAVLQQMVGVNSVVAYGTEITSQTAKSLIRVIPILLNGWQIVATIFSSFLLGRRGRVAILQYGTLMAALSLTLIACGFILKPTISGLGIAFILGGLFIFMGNFGVSLGPVVWLYIPEIVEPEIIPFSTLANWTAASVVVITFPILSKAFGTPVPLFIFFAVWSYTSVWVNKRWLVETQNKNEKQIREEFALKAS